ncbi:MAG TPA: hypothetical protein DEG71_10330 [Clostridiales bacterium]|nr:hypothetical protein [Clostridiales bacterium]
MRNKLVGRKVYITDKESIYYNHWGIIINFDGDYYHISGGSISDSSNNLTPVFDRKQFIVKRIKKKGG